MWQHCPLTLWHAGDSSPDVPWPVSRACFALLSAADYCQRHTLRRVEANQQLPPKPGAWDMKASALWSGNRSSVLDGPWIMGGFQSIAHQERWKKTAGARRNIPLPSHWPTLRDAHLSGYLHSWLFTSLAICHLCSEWKSWKKKHSKLKRLENTELPSSTPKWKKISL